MNLCKSCGELFEAGYKKRQQFCSVNCRSWGVKKKVLQSNILSDLDCAYLAGLVDGEGSILLYRRETTAKFRVVITSTFISVLDWIKEKTGIGSIVKKNCYSDKHKLAYHWQVNSEAAISVIKQIEPYLIIKKNQAAVAMDFQEKLSDPQWKSKTEWQIRYLDLMQLLNKRGPDSVEECLTINN